MIDAPPSWAAVLSRHLALHPVLETQELRKLVHQACCGPGHAIADAASARRRVHDEARALRERLRGMRITRAPDTGRSAIEPIAPHASMVRVHLAPLLDREGALDALADAFLASAAMMPDHDADARRAIIAPVCDTIDTWLHAHAPSLHRTWRADCTHWLDVGCPPVPHSDAFRAAERPAYRVVSGTLVDSLLT
jgi:hypothetical protein